MSNLTMADVKRNNKQAGRYWFSPDTMGFFNSRVESELVAGKFFVTSEQRDWDAPRLYSIRKYDPETHQIGTVGDFQAFKTCQDALDAIPTEG